MMLRSKVTIVCHRSVGISSGIGLPPVYLFHMEKW